MTGVPNMRVPGMDDLGEVSPGVRGVRIDLATAIAMGIMPPPSVFFGELAASGAGVSGAGVSGMPLPVGFPFARHPPPSEEEDEE